ncbi:MAG: hypothetical protein MUF18_16070 [Fimbriiglobus sp.]|nr:hypothetical protein [Fimbriiglobus sp.]
MADARSAVYQQIERKLEFGEPVWDPTHWLAAPDSDLSSELHGCAFYSANRRASVPDNAPDYEIQAEGVSERERLLQCDLLRCIFGNPFRPVSFDPAWITETAVALAAGIYADRALDRLPILADALEDAGCDHPDVLSHCRGPGAHARGCWVVDGVLGRS